MHSYAFGVRTVKFRKFILFLTLFVVCLVLFPTPVEATQTTGQHNQTTQYGLHYSSARRTLGKSGYENNANARIVLALEQNGYGYNGYHDFKVKLKLTALAPELPNGQNWNWPYGSNKRYARAICRIGFDVFSYLPSGAPMDYGDFSSDSDLQNNNERYKCASTGQASSAWNLAGNLISLANTAMGYLVPQWKVLGIPSRIVSQVVFPFAMDTHWGQVLWWHDNYAQNVWDYGPIASSSPYAGIPYHAPEVAEAVSFFWWHVPRSGSGKTYKLQVRAFVDIGKFVLVPFSGYHLQYEYTLTTWMFLEINPIA
jgi:hypothetical protein